jgi:hypothetical protein
LAVSSKILAAPSKTVPLAVPFPWN